MQRPLLQQSETEYQILTSVQLDREQTSKYNLSLECSDMGTPPQTASRHLQVFVLDENDNQPVFGRQEYRVTMTENNDIGASVIQIRATDSDIGDNGRLRYTISGPSAAVFAVDERGLVTAKQSLDREQNSVHRFQLYAVDSGVPPKIGTALVVIQLEDEDDDGPSFAETSYTFTVSENEPAGSVVGSVTAVDMDLPPNNMVRYFFLHENFATECCFAIDPYNGTITTLTSLNREVQPVYYLVVTSVPATPAQPSSPPAGTPTRAQNTASVVIYVGDTNDNDPVFEFPSLTNSSLQISSHFPVGVALATLVARDGDADNNAKIGYRLQTSTSDNDLDTNVFKVDPVLGSLFLERSLEDVDFYVFKLTVVATDQGIPERSTTGHLNVIVNKTIPYVALNHRTQILSQSSYLFILVLLVICCLVLGLLALVLISVKKRQREQHALGQLKSAAVACGNRDVSNSSSRTEAVKMLTTKDNVCSSAEGTPIKVSFKSCLTSSKMNQFLRQVSQFNCQRYIINKIK